MQGDTSDDENDTSTLPSSRLGTQTYWESVYQREVSNFTSDGDRGEVWFGQEAASTMLEYLDEHRQDFGQSPTVLDVGSGNGHLLFSLCGVPDEEDDEDDEEEPREPFTLASRMCGIDYSPASIQLCQEIAKSKAQDWTLGDEYLPTRIRWADCDVLSQDQVKQVAQMPNSTDEGGWEIVLDKGTLDAIALTPVETPNAQDVTPLDKYIQALEPLTRKSGLLLITSCNFTAEELVKKITARKAFAHIETLPAKRQFQFGGVKGSTTVCVAFRRSAE